MYMVFDKYIADRIYIKYLMLNKQLLVNCIHVSTHAYMY